MIRSAAFILLLLYCSSCDKKRTPEIIIQRSDNYVQPSSREKIETSEAYISPSDAFSDRSMFDTANFKPANVNYHGTRNIFYHIITPPSKTKDILIVVEYLTGYLRSGDTTSTASRILVYVKKELAYRKAFPIEFTGPVNFSQIQKFDYTVFNVTLSKSIIYYWFNVIRTVRIIERKYQAVCVDKEGIVNEFSGDLTRIGQYFNSIRFINKYLLTAKVAPHVRYPSLTIDVAFSVDWNTCTAMLDVPVDTVFTVSAQPSRSFNRKLRLFSSPVDSSQFRETNFRQLTQAQLQRIFVPSFFTSDAIDRDRLFIDFNRTTKGWIDHETMISEGIVLKKR